MKHGKDNHQYKHGMRYTRQYNCWQKMKQRCNNTNDKHYKYYGGKGVSYDPRWEIFDNFWADVGEKYEKFVRENPDKMPTIDRIDSNGNYTKKNTQVISHSENIKRRNDEHGNPTPPKPVTATCIKTGKEYHFSSTNEAERQGYADKSLISKCCRRIKHHKTAGGYQWKFT